MRNEWFSRILGNLVVGLSHAWWNRKHSRHHAHPNRIGKDEDIATGTLVFDPEDVPRRTGIVGWITRHQGWLFFPMLTLEGINLHVSAVRTIVEGRDLKHRRIEGALIAVRLVGFAALVLGVLGLGLPPRSFLPIALGASAIWASYMLLVAGAVGALVPHPVLGMLLAAVTAYVLGQGVGRVVQAARARATVELARRQAPDELHGPARSRAEGSV